MFDSSLFNLGLGAVSTLTARVQQSQRFSPTPGRQQHNARLADNSTATFLSAQQSFMRCSYTLVA